MCIQRKPKGKFGAYYNNNSLLDGKYTICDKTSTLKNKVIFEDGYITELIAFGYEDEEISMDKYLILDHVKGYTLFYVSSKEGDNNENSYLIVGDFNEHLDVKKLSSIHFKSKVDLKNVYIAKGQLEERKCLADVGN